MDAHHAIGMVGLTKTLGTDADHPRRLTPVADSAPH
jgi:hypothetical protein